MAKFASIVIATGVFLAGLDQSHVWAQSKAGDAKSKKPVTQKPIKPSGKLPQKKENLDITKPKGPSKTVAVQNPKNPAAEAASKAQGAQVSKGVVKSIQIKGNKKIESDAILVKLKTKIGDNIDKNQIRDDVVAIYNMGYFYNVEVDQSFQNGQLTLTYSVVEKPSVVEIRYDGNDEISDDDLAEATGLKAYEILSHSRIKEAEAKILKKYEDKGYFLARVTSKITDVQAGESVKVTFDLQENDKVKVKKFIFIGNRNIKDGEILNVFATKEDGFFSFLTSSGSFKQDAFDRDMEVVKYLYVNQGYVQAQFGKPEITVTPDKKNIFISLRIEEGDQYSVGNVDFSGDLLYTREELFDSIKIKDAGIFSYETLQNDLKELQAKYGDLGYAYANILPRMNMREKEKLVDITFEIDKGNKVYFGEFNVSGNTKTRDKVVRRELDIREGELYNETRKRESMEKVKRLGYFEDAAFNSKTPVDQPDVMDLDIAVKERNTGSIQVGAGYSSYSEFVFNGQLQQSNLFGKGQKLAVSVDLNKKSSIFRLSFTEPYFYDTLWSVGGDIYRSQVNRDIFSEVKEGGAARFGHPIAPYLDGFIRYKNDRTQIKPIVDQDKFDSVLYPLDTANGRTSSFTFTIEYDKRDDRMSPSNGLLVSGSSEFTNVPEPEIVAKYLRYTKGDFNVRAYKKIFWDIVWRHNLAYGFITSPNPEGPPFNELFSLGGANSLRGFEWFSIGKKKYSSVSKAAFPTSDGMVVFGGTQQLYYNMEFEFPLITEAGIKGVLFYDIGNADDVLRAGDFRADVGFGIRWFSPIGPLRFEWGFPIDPQPNDKATNFEFAIGSPF